MIGGRPVKCPLLSGSVLPPLPLLCRLHLPIRQLLNAESASGLVVAVGGALNVLDGEDSIRLIVDMINEVVRHTLIGGTQKPVFQ